MDNDSSQEPPRTGGAKLLYTHFEYVNTIQCASGWFGSIRGVLMKLKLKCLKEPPRAVGAKEPYTRNAKARYYHPISISD